MSISDRRSISKILNRTNFKIMAWYFSPRDSAQSGLKRVKMAYKMPMQSTGKEKFTVYIYYKTELYNPEEPWSDSDSECSDNDTDADEDLYYYSNDDEDSDHCLDLTNAGYNKFSGKSTLSE